MSEQQDMQKRTNTSNKLYGRYRAEVVNVEHPDKLYMVTVRVLNLWDAIPDEDLPFAEFLLPLGANVDAGTAVPVVAGELVWIEFPRNGDTRYPLITGSVYHAPEYRSNLPKEVNGEAYEPKRSPSEPKPPAYDRKDWLFERFGFREHKTHNGGWSVTHIETGTGIEITPSGQLVLHTEGDQFQSATGKHLGQYQAMEIIVKGDATVKCDGNGTLDSGANATVKAGGDLNLEAGGNINMKATMVTGSATSYDFK